MDIDFFLALLIIKKGDSYSNSYGLIRALERHFKIINTSGIIDAIKQHKFVAFEIRNGFNYFQLSNDGLEIFRKNRDVLIPALKVKYPDEIDFIQYLER